MVGEAGSGPPRRFHDRYLLESRIATGGMGAVFAAVDERLGRRIAVKLLRGDLARDPRFVERFRREARAVAALAHPNIAGVFDYGEEDGEHFIVMELADGRDLARVLREEGRLSPDRAVRIAEQICDALGHAHAAGVVHRDVKPANVIVGEQDLVKVTDFGIARVMGDSTLTATGSVLGSAHYISTEQANGAPATPASDIYSTGIVVYEMLTGSLPFTGDSPVGVAMRHVTDDVPAPSGLNPDVPPGLDRVVATATARAADDRFPDAAAMATALQESVGRAAVSAPVTVATPREGDRPTAPMTDPGQTVWPIPGDRWDPQRIGKAVALVFALLLAVAIALVVLRITDDDPRRGRRTARRGANPAAARAESAVESPSPETAVVPNVVGEPYDDAEKILLEAGFVAARNDLPMEGVEEGEVHAMDPPADSAAAPGSTITLSVGTAPENGDEEDEEDAPPGHGGEPPGQQKKDKDEEKGKDG